VSCKIAVAGRSFFSKRRSMKHLALGMGLILVSVAAVVAQCHPGDESGRVYKVIDEDVSSQVRGGPQAASEDGPKPTTVTMRTATFSFGKKRYSLRLSSLQNVNLSAGQGICLRNENGEARIMTQQGLLLPGVAHLVPAIPGNKKPGVSARPVQSK